MIKSDINLPSVIIVTAFNLIDCRHSSIKAFIITPVKPINGVLDLHVSQRLFSSIGLIVDVDNKTQVESMKSILSNLSFSLAQTLPDLTNVIGCHVVNLKNPNDYEVMPLSPCLSDDDSMDMIINTTAIEFIGVKIKSGKSGVNICLPKNINIEQERQALYLLLDKNEPLLSNKHAILKRGQLYQSSLLVDDHWCNVEKRTTNYKLGLYDTSRGRINSLTCDLNCLYSSSLLVDGKIVLDNSNYLQDFDVSDKVFSLASKASHEEKQELKTKNWLNVLPTFGVQF
ncbi:hypothetical protein [Photobacterium phosphoreum]|uniref:hypothetical protein n=1 Tax=Photobacterium phosphoreum TaxID=659 RepID=UPI0011B29DC9|nr:hypothetical protein [Photobacterium phosphoreum]